MQECLKNDHWTKMEYKMEYKMKMVEKRKVCLVDCLQEAKRTEKMSLYKHLGDSHIMWPRSESCFYS